MIVKELQKAIKKYKKRIIAVVTYYPNPATGIADDISEISNICYENDLYCHVDATYGGFIGAFRNSSLVQVKNNQKFDFSLPGVTSLTSDLSKYGMAPIGISFLAYKNRNIRKNQYYSYPKFMGGIYASPTLSGSKTASFIMASYMTLLNLGYGKFEFQATQISRLVIEISNKIRTKITKLKVIGTPELNMISFTSSNISITKLYLLMKEKKWDLTLRFRKTNIKKNNSESVLAKDSLSFILTSCNIVEVQENFLKDLESCVNLCEDITTKLENQKSILEIESQESGYIKTLRYISSLPAESQNRVLKDYISAQTDFPK